MNFSQYDKVGAVVLANDTGVALFANDSISLQIKYQTGVVVLNSSGAVDTAWRNQVIMDTMLTDSLGKQVNKNVVTAGTMVETFKMGRTDTLSVTGYAALTIPPIAAPQAECIRFIVTGLGANSAVGGSVVGKLVACLRPFAPVQDK
jgi:maltoporin